MAETSDWISFLRMKLLSHTPKVCPILFDLRVLILACLTNSKVISVLPGKVIFVPC